MEKKERRRNELLNHLFNYREEYITQTALIRIELICQDMIELEIKLGKIDGDTTNIKFNIDLSVIILMILTRLNVTLNTYLN